MSLIIYFKIKTQRLRCSSVIEHVFSMLGLGSISNTKQVENNVMMYIK